jgi:hypothetical protein
MKRLLALLLCSAVVTLSGCSTCQAPSAISFCPSEQRKIVAAGHWDVLAEYQARRIIESVNDKAKPVYIETPVSGRGAFLTAYPKMLREHLVRGGQVVVTQPTSGGAIASYGSQVIHHSDCSHIPTGSGGLTHFKNGVVEVIITTKVLEGNLVLMSDTESFYFNPGDKDHYLDQIALRHGPLFEVVDQ